MSDIEKPPSDEEAPSANVVFPRKLLRRFILTYKDLPCLWDRDDPGYKHKRKRHEAVTRLTELVQLQDPSATRVHVLRKIESLRACVRREHKRVRDSRRKANSPDEIYKPHLWYYDLFSFVFNEDRPSFNNYGYNYIGVKANNKKEPAVVEYDEDDDEVAEDDDQQRFEPPESYQTDYSSLATSMVEVAETGKQFTNFEEDPSKNAKRHCTEVEDEYDAIGVNVAAKLRNLPNNMRILAEKLINDVLFQAQLNGLNSSTVITTPDPFKSSPI